MTGLLPQRDPLHGGGAKTGADAAGDLLDQPVDVRVFGVDFWVLRGRHGYEGIISSAGAPSMIAGFWQAARRLAISSCHRHADLPWGRPA